jgi:hypothetical protein
MEKKELKEEIKKVLEGKSIYEMSPISGLNPMTKEEIIYWIVETYIDQELDKAREEGKREGSEITSRYISDFVKSESGKSGRKEILEYIEELSKLKQ